jgi:hypothetical protein
MNRSNHFSFTLCYPKKQQLFPQIQPICRKMLCKDRKSNFSPKKKFLGEKKSSGKNGGIQIQYIYFDSCVTYLVEHC